MSYLKEYPETVYPVRAIEFSPNADVSFILAMWDRQCVVYSSRKKGGVQSLEIPYKGEELREISYDYQVDFLFLAHPDHEPKIIKYTGDPDTPFVLENLQDQPTWKAPPFLKEDTSGTELVVSEEVNFVKLVGSDPNTFTNVPSNLLENPTYIELKVNNKWTVYRLVDKSYSLKVPSDPRPTFCYAEPVSSVVDSLPPSAQFALLKPDYPEKTGPLGSNERELRSDTLVFNYDLENAYARIPLNYGKEESLNGVKKLWGVGVDAPREGETHVWVQFKEYLGQDDFSEALWEDGARIPASGSTPEKNVSKEFFETGHIYRIQRAGGFSITVGAAVDPEASSSSGSSGVNRYHEMVGRYSEEQINNGEGASDNVDWTTGFNYSTEGDTFALSNKWRINRVGGWQLRLADMSRAKTFDVMKTSKPLSIFRPPDGSHIVFDGTEDFHEARLTASKDFFEEQVDVGRYLMVKYATRWTTYKIQEVVSATEVKVEVLDVIPVLDEKGDYEMNGRSSVFRMSAWKAAKRNGLGDVISPGDWPFTIAFYEQRMVFGGSHRNPESIWFSKITDIYDFRTIESDGEVLDTTGITYPLGGRSYNRIKWLSAGTTLLIGTESTEWQLKPNNFREALTPTNVRITQETTEGSSLFAIRAGASIIFPDRTGEFIRQLQYNVQIDQFEPMDLTLLSDHLFRGDPVVDFAYQKTPKPTFWFVTQSGLCYLMAFNPSQDVLAWSRFMTRAGDKVLSVAVMERNANNANDRVYLMVQRNGRVHVEYVEDVYYEEISNLKQGMNFLDCATKYAFEGNFKQFTGLDRFDDTYVGVVVDGAYVGEHRVQNGVLDLSKIDDDLYATESVVVGYTYVSRYVSNPLSMQVDQGANYGKRTRLIKMGGYLYQSLGFKMGIKNDELREVSFRDIDSSTMDESPPLFTGFLEDEIFDNRFSLENQVVVEQMLPYPLTLICLLPEF